MPKHSLIQISDIHLSANTTILPGIRPRENLIAVLDFLASAQVHPDVIVLTGDLANAGEPECYDDLASLIDEAASLSGAKVLFIPGNHDRREAFRLHLLDEKPSSAPINQVMWHEGLRIVAIDSTVEGEDFGFLVHETLEFLGDVLASHAPDGTVLALHHPPILSPIEPMSNLRLQQAERLAEAITGSDVRLVICGHNHHEASGTIGTIPVWVSPSTAYRADVTSRFQFRGLVGSAVSWIDLHDENFTVGVIPVPVPGLGNGDV
jgi:3',5'-cyclic-AMP phosphodiesterase